MQQLFVRPADGSSAVSKAFVREHAFALTRWVGWRRVEGVGEGSVWRCEQVWWHGSALTRVHAHPVGGVGVGGG